MKLTVSQVAEKLGVSNARVRTMIKQGIFHDLKERGENKKRHYSLIDSANLTEYRKQTGSARVSKKSNGSGPLPPEPQAPPLQGIHTRLQRIEDKLDRLIQIWI